MIDGDEKANNEYSSNGDEDVGAGAGARGKFFNSYRCVFATLLVLLRTRNTALVQRGMGMLIVRTSKTIWAFDAGEAAPRYWT